MERMNDFYEKQYIRDGKKIGQTYEFCIYDEPDENDEEIENNNLYEGVLIVKSDIKNGQDEFSFLNFMSHIKDDDEEKAKEMIIEKFKEEVLSDYDEDEELVVIQINELAFVLDVEKTAKKVNVVNFYLSDGSVELDEDDEIYHDYDEDDNEISMLNFFDDEEEILETILRKIKLKLIFKES